jgi:CheY-like chemotaxis protein
MNIVCVKCGTGVAYGLASLADQAVVVCPGCGVGLRVALQPFTVPAAASVSPSPGSGGQGRVVVAVEGEATREVIRDLLNGAGYTVIEATSGREAVEQVNQQRPMLAVVDVGLTDMVGHQVCEAIRGGSAGAAIKIILVAAIHNKARYRRQPGNLFGADDFIERHQIEGELVGKAAALCRADTPAQTVPSAAPAPEPAGPPPVREERAPVASILPPAPAAARPPDPDPKVAAQPRPVAAPVAKTADPGQEAALRLARIIVSDIALYNVKKVDEGVLTGAFFEVLRQEIEEGRRLYEERKPADLPRNADYFQQTLEQFVATRKQLLQRSNAAAA